jgi:repressor of nif and glnA expression
MNRYLLKIVVIPVSIFSLNRDWTRNHPIGGLNPISAAVETSIPVDNHNMSTLIDYNQRKSNQEIPIV